MNDTTRHIRCSISHPLHLAVLSLIALAYSSSLTRYTDISIACQAVTIAYMIMLVAISGSIKNLSFVILLIILLYPFQGIYALSYMIIVMSIIISSAMSEENIATTTIFYSFLFSILSIIYFYGNFTFLFEPVMYENYFMLVESRLVGLDGSPAYLSFVAGLGAILSCFYIRRKLLAATLAAFFIGVVLLTASRTAVIALAMGTFVSLIRGGSFTTAVAVLSTFPLTVTILYSSALGLSIPHLAWLELITSHRIVNWSNLLIHFSTLDISSILLGIGKPDAITDPAIMQSYTKSFSYNYVTYAESSILKIIVYNGLFLYAAMILYLLFFAYYLNTYKQRITLFYFLFSSIYYDAILSVQYAHLSVVLFCLTIGAAQRNERKTSS